MAGLERLKRVISDSLQKRIDEESKAKHGFIQNRQFFSENKSYPVIQAVDVDISEGSSVWAQLDKNGNAVIVGS